MRRLAHTCAAAALALATILGACGEDTGDWSFRPSFALDGLPSTDAGSYTLDFGTVAIGQKVMRSFTITNEGTSNLLIRMATEDIEPFDSDLHCAPIDSCPMREVGPGESMEVALEYRPTAVEQDDAVDFVIRTNDTQHPMVRIRLQGRGGRA
jgi:hypothetical protein